MAKILILQEDKAWRGALRRCLEGYHTVVIHTTIDEAMNELRCHAFDLVICRVHLEHENPFEFINSVRSDSKIAQTPILCFSGSRTKFAAVSDQSLADSSKLLGADQYLSLGTFCSRNSCDFTALRKAVEKVIGARAV